MGAFEALVSFACFAGATGALAPLRPPCAPLNAVSPYQSIWSCADHLYDAYPQHWDGTLVGLKGLLSVDGAVFRFLGGAEIGEQVVTQKKLEVLPTTTTYKFEAAGVELMVIFMTPAVGLDSDIVLASRPITHVSFTVSALDGQDHDVEVYFDSTAEGAVQSIEEKVDWKRLDHGPKGLSSKLETMQIGTVDQKVLAQGSDRINWGYWLVSTPKDAIGLHTVMQSASTARSAFKTGSYWNLTDDVSGARQAKDNWPVLSLAWGLKNVKPGKAVERHLTLAYDQVLSMRYFGTDMAPLWRQHWQTPLDMLEAAEDGRESDFEAANVFDKALVANLTQAGGDLYATLASLVYRQVTGGTQAVWNPVAKEAWVFMKEISSDGDVDTVDVVYPAFPMFQYLYPEYFRRSLLPLLVYGNNETKPYGQYIPYNLAWAPHHLGHWPISDLTPDHQEQMPVEESGNMLIMVAGLYKAQGSLKYLEPYVPMLRSWADYIVSSLPDPGNQLCTDDFEGPSPHNTNLAAKGIVALEAFSVLLNALGEKVAADMYSKQAFAFARNWTATAADGDHYRIQFNLPSTWSQKYNLLWQKVLGLKSFPEEVFQQENKFYQTKLQTCGVPLDNRHPYTKSDWSLWTASMADTANQFESIVNAVFKFANTTSSRVPLSDWYDVGSCKMQGFRARPVQGGIFAKMLVPTLGQHTSVQFVHKIKQDEVSIIL